MSSTVTVKIRLQFAGSHPFIVLVELDGRVIESFDADTRTEAYRIRDDIIQMAQQVGGKATNGNS